MRSLMAVAGGPSVRRAWRERDFRCEGRRWPHAGGALTGIPTGAHAPSADALRATRAGKGAATARVSPVSPVALVAIAAILTFPPPLAAEVEPGIPRAPERQQLDRHMGLTASRSTVKHGRAGARA